MDLFIDGFVTFFAVWMLTTHLPSHWMRRIVGYCGWVDLILHGSILMLFLGTSTIGLLQAEAAGICFSLYLRGYRKLNGFERMSTKGWIRYAGVWT